MAAIDHTAATSGDETLASNSDWLDAVRKQVSSLRFGQIQIVVHDARVVQIERIEKIRLETKTPTTR